MTMPIPITTRMIPSTRMDVHFVHIVTDNQIIVYINIWLLQMPFIHFFVNFHGFFILSALQRHSLAEPPHRHDPLI